MKSRSSRALVLALPFAAAFAVACAKGEHVLGDGGGFANGTTATGTGGAKTSSVSSGSFNLAAGTGGMTADGGTDGGFAVCATATAEAAFVPINMFVAVDKSASMADNDKWTDAQAAFTTFFNDPKAATLRVALRFWPDLGCDDTACSVSACSMPEVALGSLSNPAQISSLLDEFAIKTPSGTEPMFPALAGAEEWADGNSSGSHKGVVVLLSDGAPNACQTDSATIANLASTAYANYGVRTYAVGMMGSNQSLLNEIASAGATGQAFIIGSGSAANDLVAALQKIQQAAVGCDYQMPQVNGNMSVDPTLVNVTLSAPGAATTTIGKVPALASCTAAGGWYYDNNQAPTEILLCPTSCNALTSNDVATLQIVLGCATVTA